MNMAGHFFVRTLVQNALVGRIAVGVGIAIGVGGACSRAHRFGLVGLAVTECGHIQAAGICLDGGRANTVVIDCLKGTHIRAAYGITIAAFTDCSVNTDGRKTVCVGAIGCVGAAIPAGTTESVLAMAADAFACLCTGVTVVYFATRVAAGVGRSWWTGDACVGGNRLIGRTQGSVARGVGSRCVIAAGVGRPWWARNARVGGNRFIGRTDNRGGYAGSLRVAFIGGSCAAITASRAFWGGFGAASPVHA